MPNEKGAMDEFLKDIPVAEEQKVDDIFGQNLEGAPAPEPVKVEDDEDHKNRRERRLEARLQAERESSIALAARLEAFTEAQKFARDTSGDIDQSLITLYGDNEAGRQAAKITQDLLNKTKAEAREEALELYRQQQVDAQKAVAEQQGVLDNMLDSVEDEFNVDLTSNTPEARKARQGFYAALERVSPKDKSGQVTDYADPLATWEFYQSQQKPADNRAKDLGSRSMVKSGASGESKLEATAAERFLKEAGIF